MQDHCGVLYNRVALESHTEVDLSQRTVVVKGVTVMSFDDES
jgi:hypothetical protein